MMSHDVFSLRLQRRCTGSEGLGHHSAVAVASPPATRLPALLPPLPAATALSPALLHLPLLSCLVAVGNLSYDLTDQDVIDHFSQVGPVKHVRCGSCKLSVSFLWLLQHAALHVGAVRFAGRDGFV